MKDDAEQDKISVKSAQEALGLTQAVKELAESVETVAGKIDRIEEKVDRTYALLTNNDGEELPTREIVESQGNFVERLEGVEAYLEPRGYQKPTQPA